MKKNNDFPGLEGLKENPVSQAMDQAFKTILKEEKMMTVPSRVEVASPPQEDPNELSLSDGEFELSLGEETPVESVETPLDDGFELSLNPDEGLDLSEGPPESFPTDEQYGEISLAGNDSEISLGDLSDASQASAEGFGDIDLSANEGLSLSHDVASDLGGNNELSLSDDSSLDNVQLGDEDQGVGLELSEDFEIGDMDLSLSEDSLEDGSELGLSEQSLDEAESFDLSSAEDTREGSLSLNTDIPSADVEFGIQPEDMAESDLDLSFGAEASSLQPDGDFSEDAKEKLKEIDALMDHDASQVNISASTSELSSVDDQLDEPLVSPDLDLGSIDFGSEETPVAPVIDRDEKPKKRKKEQPQATESRSRDMGEDLREISGAYSGEMERLQATISNLRADREELLEKIQKLEDDKVLHSRQSLTMRAELDEKKIELTIIRKKLNEEINELKDRIKLFDEKKLILEEKNRILAQELDKASQKNKIDLKKVQMRERELEQRLELLKADAETQIRNRDLKILELKRKIDAMEFDMESISQQEKRSVESRFELEDKLEKAIKTLRTAITVLEDDSEKSAALSALKKNIEV